LFAAVRKNQLNLRLRGQTFFTRPLLSARILPTFAGTSVGRSSNP